MRKTTCPPRAAAAVFHRIVSKCSWRNSFRQRWWESAEQRHRACTCLSLPAEAVCLGAANETFRPFAVSSGPALRSPMHAVRLADLAALLSQHGPAILCSPQPIDPALLGRYWSSSRGRLDLWHQAIARHRRARSTGDSRSLRCWWRDHLGVLEEILISEMLTRVTAALAAAWDEDQGRDELSPITDAIHLGQLEASNRVQHLMLDGRGCSVSDAVRLNRLRRATERWSDALLGRMAVDTPQPVRYAIDRNRAAAHAADMRHYGRGAARETVSWLMNAAMRDTLVRRSNPDASLPQANRQVADSVMILLRPDRFDSLGALKSLWRHQMENDPAASDRAAWEHPPASVGRSTGC